MPRQGSQAILSYVQVNDEDDELTLKEKKAEIIKF